MTRILLGAGATLAIAFMGMSYLAPARSSLSAIVAQSTPAAKGPTPQVRGVHAIHRAGQTFITWQEISPAPNTAITIAELSALSKRLSETRRLRYRVYRSDRPIVKLADATPVGQTSPLSVWDREHFGIYPTPDRRPPRFVIEEGKPALPSGTGLFVHNPPNAAQAYYAVAVSENGAEVTTVTPDNTFGPVAETVGQGVPVLQRKVKETILYVAGTSHYYTRWETAENSSVPGKPFDYLVAVPPDVRTPATVGIHLHDWGGTMRSGYGWWYNAEKGAVLVSSNESPYDWWTGYHERRGNRPLTTPQEWRSGVVRPYTQKRLLSFVDWLGTTMKLDPSRMFAAGSSMGGAGSIKLAIRHPSRIAWAVSWVGLHVPRKSPTFSSSFQTVFGKPEWKVLFEDGTPVWDHFDDVWYLRRHPDKDVGFITFSNGKNDNGIGWEQAVDFFRALQETRQPHLFVWGQASHGQRAVMPAIGGERVMPLDLRTNLSLPAFTNGSLDNDPGTGAVNSGAPAGQANRYLTWRTDTITDEPARWSVEISLIQAAPRQTATVDVTPRRLQQFRLKPGDRVEWTNTAGSRVAQRGEAVADQWGLVTLPQVQVSRGGSRVAVVRR